MHKNWKFHHVAVIVKDMDKAIEFYEKFGIGPFPPLIGPTAAQLTNKTVRGEPMDYQIDLRHAEGGVGDLKLELIEPLEGETPVKEFLDKKGEGIQHIGFTVDDLDKETTKMAEKGFTPFQAGVSTNAKWAYYDTDKVGGMVIELIELIK
jgi:catechol 2,3-dioxygenase-like lactoylglutathione lyase family enzyme